MLKSGLNNSMLSISIHLDNKEVLGFGWMGNLYLWEAMTALSIVLRASLMLFSGHFASCLSSDSSSQVKNHHQQQQRKPVGGLFSNEEFKNENDLKYRSERISSCHQDATVDEHRLVNKK